MLISTSVVTNPSMVHMLGWIMPEPLHIPPMVTFLPSISVSTAISFFTVSVVIMDSAASVPAASDSERRGTIFFTPASRMSMGSCFPITPVDATSTESSGIPRISAAACAVFLQYPYPSSPVHALAIPLLQTTACAAGA